MLRDDFDPTKPYRYVMYGRFSSHEQNARSPDQQFDVIRRLIEQNNYPWQLVGQFRDDGIPGKFVRRRPQFSQMLKDIQTETLKVDLILVDTFERFGRNDELADIRRKLRDRHGVLVLTADSRFANPQSASGRVLSAFESLRATEENRIKAHNVLRGKRDALHQGHWPGGGLPYGLKLESVLGTRRGRQVVLHSNVVPDPDTAWVIRELYEHADRTKLGQTRLAQWMNAQPRFPDALKPVSHATIGGWLDNPLYHGELVWGEFCTGVIEDRRVVEANPDEDIIRIEDFCEAIVSRELSLRVKALRRERGNRIRAARAPVDEKLLTPRVRSLALKYMLSGLLECGHCGRKMTASSGSEYTDARGITKRYVSYVCPGYLSRACDNQRRVPEGWLRDEVVSALIRRLFPDRDAINS